MNPAIDISELLTAVRKQLVTHEARLRREGILHLFDLTEMEVEVAFQVTSDKKRGSKIDLKLLAVDASVGQTAQNVHRVKLKYAVNSDAAALKLPGTRAHSSNRPKKRTSSEHQRAFKPIE